MGSLPTRDGPPPATTSDQPHQQIDQQPDDPALRERLAARLLALDDVSERPSLISVPGARGLVLDEAHAAGAPVDAFMAGREFAHLHPSPDLSLHAMLPPDVAAEAIDKGWAEQHTAVPFGMAPPNAVLLYAPRDPAELEVVATLVEASHAYAHQRAGGDDRAAQ